MKHDIADAEIAMCDRAGLIILRSVRLHPTLQLHEVRHLWHLRVGQLPAPPPDLAGEVAAGAAIIAQPHSRRIHRMHIRHRSRNREVHGAAFLRGRAGQRGFVKNPPVDPVHDVERRAQNVRLTTPGQHVGHRYPCIPQCALHPVLPVNRMRALQQRTGWLFAQHHLASVHSDNIGRVGLPAGDLGHLRHTL